MRQANSQTCVREQELIGFVYGELSEVEARTFQHHLNQCDSCSTELSGFREVRESVVAWRNESLGSVGLLTPQMGSSLTPSRQRSGLAAVREFLNLSPLWMKGALAFATIVFCVLAVMAVARLRDKQPKVVAAGPAQTIQPQPDIEAIVKQRVQEELTRMKAPKSSGTVPNLDVAHNSERVSQLGSKNISRQSFSYSARRPLSKTERQQLATDLRLLSSKNDNDLDLLEDSINQ